MDNFRSILQPVLTAFKNGMSAIDAAEKMFEVVSMNAHMAAFEIELDTSESDILRALRQRVLFPADLDTVMKLVSPLMALLKEDAKHNTAVAIAVRIGRKHVLLSVALFFSECKLDLLCIFDANSLIVRIYQLPAATPPNTLRRCQALTESRQRRFPFPSRNRLDLRHRQ